MRLCIYQLKRKLWLFIVFGCAYLVLAFFQGHPEFSFYHQITEQYTSLFVGLLSVFILTSDAENEFANCYGTSFVKLGFSHWFPCFLYPMIIAFLACPLYWLLYEQGILHSYSLPTPNIAVLLFSLFVTFFLSSAFVFFVRVLIRNMYGTLGVLLMIFTPFHTLHNNLLLRKVPMILGKYDIWITGLLYSDKYNLSMNIWWINRCIYLLLGIMFFSTALLILKQKNYRNFH